VSRIGLFGGTFNPIHVGHLHVAQETLVALGLDRVVFIPSRKPPHRDGGQLADEEHRLAMVEIACASNPRFFVSRIELEREGPSYTVDTVEALQLGSSSPRAEVPPHPRLHFITGADALMRYAWRDLDRLLGMLESMVAVTRPGFPLDELAARLDRIGLRHRDRVRPLELPGWSVSSTAIRTRIAEGLPITYQVTREVDDYIAKFGLYKSGGAH
jgi:nicotinate-nucleotide adenylyltransferase